MTPYHEPRAPQAATHPAEDLFLGDGEMARLMRSYDWSASSLGPAQDWPHALKVALRLLLTSRFEMWLGWGPVLVVVLRGWCVVVVVWCPW